LIKVVQPLDELLELNDRSAAFFNHSSFELIVLDRYIKTNFEQYDCELEASVGWVEPCNFQAKQPNLEPSRYALFPEGGKLLSHFYRIRSCLKNLISWNY
jgi:hypothetical protein